MHRLRPVVEKSTWPKASSSSISSMSVRHVQEQAFAALSSRASTSSLPYSSSYASSRSMNTLNRAYGLTPTSSSSLPTAFALQPIACPACLHSQRHPHPKTVKLFTGRSTYIQKASFAHLANRSPQNQQTTSLPAQRHAAALADAAPSKSSPATLPNQASSSPATKVASTATASDVTPGSGVRQSGEQRMQDMQIIRRLIPNIWPKGDISTKSRVVIALTLLVAGKLLNVQVPFFFKSIVDSLNIPVAELSTNQTVWTVAGTVIVGCA